MLNLNLWYLNLDPSVLNFILINISTIVNNKVGFSIANVSATVQGQLNDSRLWGGALLGCCEYLVEFDPAVWMRSTFVLHLIQLLQWSAIRSYVTGLLRLSFFWSDGFRCEWLFHYDVILELPISALSLYHHISWLKFE